MKYSLIRTSVGYLIIGLLGLGRVGFYSAPMLLLSICSLLHHSKESNVLFLRLDQTSAWLVMLINAYLFVGSYESWRSIVGTLFAFLSLWRYYRKGNREINHAVWHILSAGATGLIYYGYYIAHI